MSVAGAIQRVGALDAHRGLIMVLMALDHSSYFIARAHSSEFWGAPLPFYPDAFWFWTRFVTHLCAPGFFLLMGIGMTALAASRLKYGWSENRVTSFLATRGLFLILLQLLVENSAWLVGDLFAAPGSMTVRGGVPGSGSGQVEIFLGVLFGLGATMVFWAFGRRFSSPVVALISLAAILFTQWATPSGAQTSFPYSPYLRILLDPRLYERLDSLLPADPLVGSDRNWTTLWPVAASESIWFRADLGPGRSSLSDPVRGRSIHRDLRKPQRHSSRLDRIFKRREVSTQSCLSHPHAGHQLPAACLMGAI